MGPEPWLIIIGYQADGNYPHLHYICRLKSNPLIFTLSYPYWFILLCVLLAAVFSFLLYSKQAGRFAKSVLYSLILLRFFSVFLLCFLLLAPILKYLQNKNEKPVVVFLQDNSASIKSAFKKVDSIAYRKKVTELLDDLREDYIVKELRFGGQLSDSLLFNYTETSTDISTAFETTLSNFENENLGAIIISTDGIYNKGNSPLTQSYPFKGSVYTVGLGDTMTQKDAAVARVFANKIVYLGDKFAIRSDVAAYACEGSQVSINVFSHQQNRNIAVQNFSVTNARFLKTVETIVEANSPGIHRYTISVSKIDGEQNVLNNAQDVYVEVLDSKERILIVAAAPHPDVSAIKEALSKNKNYTIDIAMADKAVSKINEYNLVILHNLPSVLFSASTLIDKAQKLGVSIWYIVGSQTALPLFNKAQSGLQIIPKAIAGNDVQGYVNKDFSFFSINQNYASSLAGLSPLSVPFGEYKTGSNAQVLMNQKIGNVASSYPLWVLQPVGVSKLGVLAGEGIWRWRFYDFFLHKNHDAVDDFILKTAQYLSVKHDKKQFRSQLAKSIFSESENITIDAELYNENFELVNTPDVKVALISEDGKRLEYSMNKSGNSYSLNIGNLSAGTYNYSCTCGFNGKSFSSNGSFNVVYQNIEQVNTTADFGTLSQLAQNYNGAFVFPNELSSIKDKIQRNERVRNIIRTESHIEPLINWKWLFLLLLVLLGAEWYIRKTNGAY